MWCVEVVCCVVVCGECELVCVVLCYVGFSVREGIYDDEVGDGCYESIV